MTAKTLILVLSGLACTASAAGLGPHRFQPIQNNGNTQTGNVRHPKAPVQPCTDRDSGGEAEPFALIAADAPQMSREEIASCRAMRGYACAVFAFEEPDAWRADEVFMADDAGSADMPGACTEYAIDWRGFGVTSRSLPF